MKKAMVAVAALIFAAVLAAPSKANAEVVFRVGVGPVVVSNAPASVVVAPAPYVAYAPAYVYPVPIVYREHAWVRRGCARPYEYRRHEWRHEREWRR
jgi:hypothetical protein